MWCVRMEVLSPLKCDQDSSCIIPSSLSNWSIVQIMFIVSTTQTHISQSVCTSGLFGWLPLDGIIMYSNNTWHSNGFYCQSILVWVLGRLNSSYIGRALYSDQNEANKRRVRKAPRLIKKAFGLQWQTVGGIVFSTSYSHSPTSHIPSEWRNATALIPTYISLKTQCLKYPTFITTNSRSHFTLPVHLGGILIVSFAYSKVVGQRINCRL